MKVVKMDKEIFDKKVLCPKKINDKGENNKT